VKNHVLERKVLDRLEAVLREEGFAEMELHPSPHSWTLSAEKGSIRLVTYLEDQDAPPSPRTGLNLKLTRGYEQQATASLPGVSAQPGGSLVGGGGGGAAADER
jgi:hypothetical protein